MATSPHGATPEPLMDRSKIEVEAPRSQFKEIRHKNNALEVLKAASIPPITNLMNPSLPCPKPRVETAAAFKLRWFSLSALCLMMATFRTSGQAADADLILHHGKVATVDGPFTIHQAIAIQGGRILQTGGDVEVLRLKGPRTEVVDLQGKLVLPGLIDSHAHPADACLTEFEHAIPPMECIQDVLDYIQARTRVVKAGEWIEVRQVFITRLREQRYPTRAELDRTAPEHPVLFATGPDASLNRLALRLSGIDRDFEVTDGGTGFAEKDPSTGEPTGILRNCTRYVKVQSARHPPSRADKVKRLKELFADYNSVGITGVGERDAGSDAIETYQELRRSGGLTVRASLSQHIESIGTLSDIQESIRQVRRDPGAANVCERHTRFFVLTASVP